MIAFISCTLQVLAKTIDVRLRIRQRKTEEIIITRENLIKIQQFILKQGKRQTYCNMYNDNPASQTKNYLFYLNPDNGQMNINCDPTKSEFHSLTIRRADYGKNQYRTVEFLDKHDVYIIADWPTDDLANRKNCFVHSLFLSSIFLPINSPALPYFRVFRGQKKLFPRIFSPTAIGLTFSLQYICKDACCFGDKLRTMLWIGILKSL